MVCLAVGRVLRNFIYKTVAKIKKNLKAVLLLFLAANAMLIWSAVFYFETRPELAVTFFDVGQGDSTFIELANGNQILIDGGPGDRVLAKLGRRMPFWDRSIDLLILTHPEADHLNGLLEVAKRYEVGLVLETGVNHPSPQYREWQDLIKAQRIPVVIAERGQRVWLGRSAVIEILAPFENYAGTSVGKVNNTSIVGRLVHGKNSILLTGDIEKQVERRLVFESLDSKPAPLRREASASGFLILDSDVLKVPHHGSKTSSSEEFLGAVSPEVAVIQVGKNRYGHPTQEVLDRLAVVGARIFRNDLDGDITFESDGNSFWKE